MLGSVGPIAVVTPTSKKLNGPKQTMFNHQLGLSLYWTTIQLD
jgi:hypothetical protein